jgi:hypothetical protein
VSAKPTPRLHIAFQGAAIREGAEMVFEVDYALAQYRLTDALQFRVGRVKQPFGLATEVFHVGTLRPFFNLPLSIYGATGILSEGFQGASLAGGRSLGGQWSIGFDAYGGELKLLNTPPLVVPDDSNAEDVTNLMGARVKLHSPVGVNVGVSAYTGHAPGDAGDRHNVVGGQLEYDGSAFLLRTEMVRRRAPDQNVSAAYVEAGYRLTPQWQVVARTDGSNTTFGDLALDSIPQGGKHREGAAGLNYWFGPEFVLKFSVHRTTGRRFALDESGAHGEAIPGRLPRSQTTLLVFGAQFAF